MALITKYGKFKRDFAFIGREFQIFDGHAASIFDHLDLTFGCGRRDRKAGTGGRTTETSPQQKEEAIMTKSLKQTLLAGTFALASATAMTGGAQAASSSCDSNGMCAIPIISGAKCALSAYTNAGYTWTMSASFNKDGSKPFNTQEGSGENDTPMKWTSGNAIFQVGADMIFVKFAANGGSAPVKMMTGSGFAEGTSSAIMNGEDGADNDFNDVIANVTCIE